MPAGRARDVEMPSPAKLRLVDTRSEAFRKELATPRDEPARPSSAISWRATGMDLVVFDASGSMVDPLLKFLPRARAEAPAIGGPGSVFVVCTGG